MKNPTKLETLKKQKAKRQAEELELFRKALTIISTMGDGIKDGQADWSNIGKNAKFTAKQALDPKCPTCGK